MKWLQIKVGALVLLLTSSFLIVLTQNVFACSPAGPDPWFTTKLTFNQSTLPSGIEIVQTESTYEPYALINKNSEPFYLIRKIDPIFLSRPYGNEYRFPNSELPEGYEPLYKITNNQVYTWDYIRSKDTNGWIPNSGGINNSNKTRLSIGEDTYILDGESTQIYEDNRLEDVEIPAPQSFKILGFYRGNPVEIQGTLSYFLNEKYDPQRYAKGVAACNSWAPSPRKPSWEIISYLPLIITLGAVLGVGFLVYIIIKRFSK